MKKILFIVSNMESGGVSKSMSTLLNVIDTSRFEVDVLIVNPNGVFMELLPSNINVIRDAKTELLFSDFPANITKLVQKGFLYTAIIRLIAALFMTFNKGWGGKLLSKHIVKINKEYDLAVDYNGQHQLYYLVDAVMAKVKVSFFHSDYAKWDYYYTMDRKYFAFVDKIFTISETCVNSMKKYFSEYAAKIEIFENISSQALIENLAKSKIEMLHENSIISVGHLIENKGTLLALNAAEILKQRGINFKWYFVGKMGNDHNYKELVEAKELNNHIVIIGVTPNPYPYIKNAKIMVHLSYFEGKSIALDEAKLLGKPIVVTNFSTVNDQFTDDYDATICSFDEVEIASKIEMLLKDDALREKFTRNLSKTRKVNDAEIQKLYNLI